MTIGGKIFCSLLKTNFKVKNYAHIIMLFMIKICVDFFKYFAPNAKLQIVFIIIGSVIAGLIELVGVALIYPFIQGIINPASIDNIPVALLGLAIACIFIFKNLYMIFYFYIQHIFFEKGKVNISKKLMRAYLSAPYSFHINSDASVLVNNITVITKWVVNNYALMIINLLSHIIIALVLMFLLVFKYFTFALITGIILSLFIIAQNLFLKNKMTVLGRKMNRYLARHLKVTLVNLKAIKEIKVLCKEKFFMRSFENIVKKTMSTDTKISFYGQIPYYLTETIVILAILMMCGGVMIFNKSNSLNIISDFAVLAALSFRLIPVVNKIVSSLNFINNTKEMARSLINEVKQSKTTQNELDNPSENAGIITFKEKILLKNISFKYGDSSEKNIKNINMQVNKGEFVGIVGYSGAGKSTLMDILLGLYNTETSGQIFMDNIELTPGNMRSWKKITGYVPQNIYLLDDTVRKNIAFGIEDENIDDDKIIDVLKQAYLYDFLFEEKNGLDTLIGENGIKISQGQKQRIGIARALYNEPQVLLLDEATSALDTISEKMITEAINNFKGKKTIIAIAHRLSTLKNCDRLIYLEKGEIAGTGNYSELYRKIPDFAKMLEFSKIQEVS